MITGTARLTDQATGLAGKRSKTLTIAPRFGMNYDVEQGLPGVAAALGCGLLTAAKVFNGSMPASYPGHVIPASVTHPLAVIKIKLTTAAPWISAADQAGLAAVFASMPATGQPAVSINQEGDAPRFGYSGAQVAGSHATAYSIFRAHAPANAVYGQDLQTYSASSGGQGAAFPSYICCAANGQVNLPAYWLDWYPTLVTTGALASVTPAVNAIRALVPDAVLGAAECNWLAGNGAYHGPGTAAQWLADCWAYAVAERFTCFIPYYFAAHNTPWPAAGSAEMAELSSIARASGL
jgi:hypothetical protein